MRPPLREQRVRWRRPLTWVALLTLVASALYFSMTERGSPPPVPVQSR